jgi:hypothetical protein
MEIVPVAPNDILYTDARLKNAVFTDWPLASDTDIVEPVNRPAAKSNRAVHDTLPMT